MNVPRETILGGTVRPLSVRNAVADAFRAEIKRTHRVQVTHQNSVVQPGHFAGLDLESGRARYENDQPQIRARCRFDSGSVRVVTVTPVVAVGDWFWLRAGATPRTASLISLEVTDIRTGRLQDMTDRDALAEGAALLPQKFKRFAVTSEDAPRRWFANHWDSMQGVRKAPTLRASWAANPWVWIYSFKSYRQNVDAIAERLAVRA